MAFHFMRTYLPPSLLRIEAGGLDNSHHRILLPVAIDVARLELIDGVGQSPVAQPIQAVVLTSQFVALGYTSVNE